MELDGGPAGIAENVGYEGLSSSSSKPEAGHLPVFDTRGMSIQVLNALLPRQKCAADILVLRTQFYLYCWPDEHPLNLLVRLTVIFNIM